MTFSGPLTSAAVASTSNCSGRSLHQVGCCKAIRAPALYEPCSTSKQTRPRQRQTL